MHVEPEWTRNLAPSFADFDERRRQPEYGSFGDDRIDAFYEGFMAGNRNGVRMVFEGLVNITIVKTYEEPGDEG